MAGITGLSTTFNLPNYHGELFALTPTETPFLSMSGGIGGGRQTLSTEFEWQTYDLRDPSIRTRVEGANAPTAEARVRANVKNVVQVYHEAVSTSYTKQAAIGQFATTQGAPFWTYDGLGTGNPVPNEHTWQIMQALKELARDINFAFWHAQKNVPTDTSSNRQMAGLPLVITTNKTFATTSGTDRAATTATNVITDAGHGLSNGDQIVFTNVDVATNVRLDRSYYVVGAATTFQIAATPGGTAIVLGTAAPRYLAVSGATTQTASHTTTGVTVDRVNALVQSIFDNGGMTDGETRTLFVPSIQKTLLTKAYATAYGSNVNGAIGMNTGHTVGGVAVDHIVTDFGELNLVVERALPKDMVVAVSMDTVDPVFLSIPDRGVLFEEQLAKVGSADNTQIYGEIGLAYGAERMHGVLRGLAVEKGVMLKYPAYPGPYADQDDLVGYWRVLSDGELDRADVLLQACADLINELPNPTSLINSATHWVSLDAVKRTMIGGGGVKTLDQLMVGMLASQTFANPMGNLYITDGEIKQAAGPFRFGRRVDHVDVQCADTAGSVEFSAASAVVHTRPMGAVGARRGGVECGRRNPSDGVGGHLLRLRDPHRLRHLHNVGSHRCDSRQRRSRDCGRCWTATITANYEGLSETSVITVT